MRNVSVVMAVHDDAEYLPYSLSCLLLRRRLFFEVVLVLDRCSEAVKEKLVGLHGDGVFVVQKELAKWRNQNDETKELGRQFAGGDFVLYVDADVVFDFAVFEKALGLLDCFDAVVFGYKQFSLFGGVFARVKDLWCNLLLKAVRVCGVHPFFGGQFVARRDFSFVDEASAYDGLLRKCRRVFVPSQSLHLRPRYDRSSQFARGVARRGLGQYSFFKVLLMSFLLFEPCLFAGFVHG